MEKRGLQRGSVRRFRVSGTDEQNHQRAQGRRASGWTSAFPEPCPLCDVQGPLDRRSPCSVGSGWADCCRTAWVYMSACRKHAAYSLLHAISHLIPELM